MLTSKIAVAAVAAAFLCLSSGTVASAQTPTDPRVPPSIDNTGTENPTDRRITGERVMPGRVGGDRRNRTGQQQRQARLQQQRSQVAAAVVDPEQLRIAAQAIATTTAPNCQVTESATLGVTAENQPIFEAACATGPGYVLIASTPPQAVDCLVLAGQAELDRSRDPAADVGLQCQLPVNTDAARVVRGYATEAGISCTVDQGASIGRSSGGNLIYEVGCAGTDGYWIEKTATSWEKTTCMQIVTQNAECRFTDAPERAATLKAMLAGSAAAGCDVSEARYMGANANGAFYEAKCGAGDGYIARADNERVVQQVYPCAEATRIGGGCTLTAAVAPPAPASE